jgi:hypothetical protein
MHHNFTKQLETDPCGLAKNLFDFSFCDSLLYSADVMKGLDFGMKNKSGFELTLYHILLSKNHLGYLKNNNFFEFIVCTLFAHIPSVSMQKSKEKNCRVTVRALDEKPVPLLTHSCRSLNF